MEGGKVLARYEQSAREFLYPTPTLTGKDGMDRELLLSRTVHFTVSVQEPLWIMYMYLTLLPSLIKLSSDVMFGRCSGFMVSALVSKSSSRSLSPGLRHCAVFLGKTLYPHSTSLCPGVLRKRVLASLMLGVALRWTRIPFRWE